MTDLTTNNFGLTIAYLIPGFVVVASTADRLPLVAGWLDGSVAQSPTVGGFLFITIASVTAGLILSVIRWLTMDVIHHHTGIRPPKLDFAQLSKGLTAFEAVVDNHFRYYQAYTDLFLALVIVLSLHPNFPQTVGVTSITGYFVAGTLLVILFFASRDALHKYYDRTLAVLNSPSQTQEKSK